MDSFIVTSLTMCLVSLVAATAVLAAACATSVRLEVDALEPSPTDLNPPADSEDSVAAVDAVRAAVDACARYSSFEMMLETDTRTNGADLDVTNLVLVDRVWGVFDWQLRLIGDDWPDRVGSDASGQPFVESTFRSVGDGLGPLYFTLDPLPAKADPAKPWVRLTSAQLGLAGEVNAVVLNPRAAVSGFPFLEGDLSSLEHVGRDDTDGEDMEHHRIVFPHAAMMNYLLGSLAQALVDEGITNSSFVGSTTVDFGLDERGRKVSWSTPTHGLSSATAPRTRPRSSSARSDRPAR